MAMLRNTLHSLKLISILALGAVCGFAQNASVPSNYQSVYTELQNDISSFNATVMSQWNGSKGNTLWSGELLAANANSGLSLLKGSSGPIIELNALQALGAKSVVVNMAFPIVNSDFYTYNGDPQDYQSMVNFYSNL